MRTPLLGFAAALSFAAACNTNNGTSTITGSTGGTSTGATGAAASSGNSSGSVATTSSATGSPLGSTSGATSGSINGSSTGGTSGGAPDSGLPQDLAGFYACGCVSPSPFCAPSGGGGCVACLADPDCPVSAPFCVNGGCEACRTKVDCAAGQICNGFSNTCAPDCRIDAGASASCGQGTTCELDAGLCTLGCASDTDCEGLTSPFCVGGLCAECRTPADCPIANAGCSSGTCGRCQQSTDCGDGLTCLGQSFNMYCGCKTSTQCTPFGQVCVPTGADAGSCGCNTSADCAVGQTCDFQDFAFPGVPAALGQCVTACNQDGGFDCLAAAWQVTGAPFCNPSTGMCASCTTDADCLSPTTTQGGPDRPVCVGAGQAASPLAVGGGGVCGCTASDQCPTGTVCDTVNDSLGAGVGKCVPACDLASGTNCDQLASGTLFCAGGTGLCSPCQSNAQCRSLFGSLEPVCLSPGPIVGPLPLCGCQSSSDCNQGELCDVSNVASGQCLRPCGADGGTNCGLLATAGQCNPGTQLCSACLSNADCTAQLFSIVVTPICELDAGFCTQCGSAADCTPSHPGCVPQLGCGFCLSEADCVQDAGLSCDLTTNICRHACTTSFDGGASSQCPAAQPFCDADAGLCWECRDTADCAGKGTATSILCFTSTHQCNGEGPDAGGAG